MWSINTMFGTGIIGFGVITAVLALTTYILIGLMVNEHSRGTVITFKKKIGDSFKVNVTWLPLLKYISRPNDATQRREVRSVQSTSVYEYAISEEAEKTYDVKTILRWLSNPLVKAKGQGKTKDPEKAASRAQGVLIREEVTRGVPED
jgi:hypothetical protein